MRLEVPQDPVEQAEAYVAFGAAPEAAFQALRAWLGTLGFFRPSDLAREASLQSMRALWWAGWAVNVSAFVSWTADSDAGAIRSAWAPHAGQTPLRFDNLIVSASRGLAHKEAARLAPSYDLRYAHPQPYGPPGAVVESFELQRSAARRVVGDAIRATAQARVMQGAIPGSRFRNVHIDVLMRGLSTSRMALPAYILAYRYRGKVYRAIVHGQDVRNVFGDAPYSIAKIALVVVAALAVLGLLLLIVGVVLNLR